MLLFSSGKSNNNLSTWTLLAQSLLGSVAEGVKLGAFLAKFHLSESTLANLLNLDNKLKPAWINIMVRNSSLSKESKPFIRYVFRNFLMVWRWGQADYFQRPVLIIYLFR